MTDQPMGPVQDAPQRNAPQQDALDSAADQPSRSWWSRWFGRSNSGAQQPRPQEMTAELMRNIRRVEIKTSHIVDDLLVGRWHSAFKGRGMEFEEVRPYQVGDDVRTIDWNVTARAGEPFVKLFREEREMSVVLLVDISGSQDFGSQTQSKRQLVTELCATIALSAIKNNDKVGMTLFSDQIELSLPPRSGTRHVLRLIRELLCYRSKQSGTDLQNALEHLGRTNSRRRVVFLISDFQDSGYEKTLRMLSRRHDIVPIIIADQREVDVPAVGLLKLLDPETQAVVEVDTSSRANRQQIKQAMQSQRDELDALMRRLRLEPLHVYTGEDYVDVLGKYFQKRQARA